MPSRYQGFQTPPGSSQPASPVGLTALRSTASSTGQPHCSGSSSLLCTETARVHFLQRVGYATNGTEGPKGKAGGSSAALHAISSARRCPARRHGAPPRPALTQHGWAPATGRSAAGGGAAEERGARGRGHAGPGSSRASVRFGGPVPTAPDRTSSARRSRPTGQGRAGQGPAAAGVVSAQGRPRPGAQRRRPAPAGRTWHKHDEDRTPLLGGGDGGRDGAPEPHHGDRRAPEPRQPPCACAATSVLLRRPLVTRLRRGPEPRLLIGARPGSRARWRQIRLAL